MIDVTPKRIVRSRKLHFSSKLLVEVNDRVNPETAIAHTLLPLPRLFFLNVFSGLPDATGMDYAVGWKVKPGDLVDYGATIATFALRNSDSSEKPIKPFICPMAGIVDAIIAESGNLLLRELIDFDSSKAVVPLNGRFDIPVRLMRKFLLVREGAFVEKGQILARQMVPGKFSRIEAPIAGVVTEIDSDNRRLVIERRIEEVATFANFYGRVSSVSQREIVIEGEGVLLNGRCGIGAASAGMLAVAGESELRPEVVKGSVLLFKNSITKEDLDMAVTGKAKGIIAAGADHKALSEFVGYDLAVAFTGREDIPFPIVLTEGFGRQEMQQEVFVFLSQSYGKWVYLNGRTQLRAGVVRPEIIVLNRAE